MKLVLLAAPLLAIALPCAAAALDPTPFVRHDSFEEIRISPDGRYLAATVQLEDRRTLAILRTADRSVIAGINLGRNKEVHDFWWVGPERVVASVAQKFGALDEPQPTGELIGMDADGERSELLVGVRAYDAEFTHIKRKKGDQVAASMLDPLPGDDRHVLIEVEPFVEEPLRRVDRMDVYNGRRTTVAMAPVRNASFLTDNRGRVRFAFGYDVDRVWQVWYRADDDARWQRFAHERAGAAVETPVGFSADDGLAYLQVEREQGPDVLVEHDLASGKRRVVMEDDDVDAATVLYRAHTRTPVGVEFQDGKPRSAFLDDTTPEARLHRSLSAAFAGNAVRITSMTADGGLALVLAWSDRNPGDYYLFDVRRKKADYLLSGRDWLDPEAMAEVRPVRLKARDGLALSGLLTLPRGRGEKGLPLVVLPHGGPFFRFDAWGFNPETQLLAAAGYTVLQVNFRGSGNHGRAFAEAGRQQWGRKMQDDVTDATRWAIAEGIADPRRICIHGASYGGYAALMGAAREPDLYRCASGYVGVYEPALLHSRGAAQRRASDVAYLRYWIGEPEQLADVSAIALAPRIKVPVLLAAGGEDERAPIVHTKRLEKALRQAGVPVETRYYGTEGHGFYTLPHMQEYYSQLLDFLGLHLGTGVATAAPAPAASAD
jgi:dipeptidyl aminopeptidase/acylaminoacyl peptidase